jgi:ATP-dependent exoDNAse (exonuclease V) alpha subunit
MRWTHFSAGRITLNERAVTVIDELSLLGTRQLNAILDSRARFNFQVVAIGDPKQMEAVEAGPVIDLLQRVLGEDAVPELIRSVRQRNGQTEEAVVGKVANGTLKLMPGAATAPPPRSPLPHMH